MIRSARFFVQFRRIAKTKGARDDSVRRGFAVKREFGTGARGARRLSEDSE